MSSSLYLLHITGRVLDWITLLFAAVQRLLLAACRQSGYLNLCLLSDCFALSSGQLNLTYPDVVCKTKSEPLQVSMYRTINAFSAVFYLNVINAIYSF